jgi:hypothetical protein
MDSPIYTILLGLVFVAVFIKMGRAQSAKYREQYPIYDPKPEEMTQGRNGPVYVTFEDPNAGRIAADKWLKENRKIDRDELNEIIRSNNSVGSHPNGMAEDSLR